MNIVIGLLLMAMGWWNLLKYRKNQRKLFWYGGIALVMLGTMLAVGPFMFEYARTHRY